MILARSVMSNSTSRKLSLPVRPPHPERVCWGCEKLCPASQLACGKERTPHPAELFGPDWSEWGQSAETEVNPPVPAAGESESSSPAPSEPLPTEQERVRAP